MRLTHEVVFRPYWVESRLIAIALPSRNVFIESVTSGNIAARLINKSGVKTPMGPQRGSNGVDIIWIYTVPVSSRQVQGVRSNRCLRMCG